MRENKEDVEILKGKVALLDLGWIGGEGSGCELVVAAVLFISPINDKLRFYEK